MGTGLFPLHTLICTTEICGGLQSRRRPRVGPVVGLIVLLVGGGFFSPARGQIKDTQIGNSPVPVRAVLSDWQDCGLRKTDMDIRKSIRPEGSVADSSTAKITVNYSGFPPKAKRAFDRAVEIWETHIRSDVTIRIGTNYQFLGRGVLGGTTPISAYPLDRDRDGESEMVVFDALADALTGENQQGRAGPDFFVSMNKGRDDWHFGKGDAPPGTVDFTTVVVHEIAHGLGYFAIQGVSDGVGAYGINHDQIDEKRTPNVYTTFLVQQRQDGTQASLVDESVFPNPSGDLASAMTSDEVVFGGPVSATVAEQNPGPGFPKIYAPSPYRPGSSVSHLDEAVYPASGQNGLMTPYLGTAETIRLPGPIVCGQLRDLGWPLGPGCLQHFKDVYGLQFAEQPDSEYGSVSLSWEVKSDARVREYIIERKYFDGAFTPIKRVERPPVTVDSLGLGTFTFRVRWVRADGSTGTTTRAISRTFEPRDVEVRTASRDQQGRATVLLDWNVPRGTEDFSYRIERQVGLGGPFVETASTASTKHSLRRQTPGTYRYRVVAVDDMGHTIFGSEKRRVEIDFDGETYVLGPYPNPARETAVFDLTAREAQPVTIEVYSVTGERLYVDQRRLGTRAPESIQIDVSRWSSGMYVLRVRGNTFTRTREMMVVE